MRQTKKTRKPHRKYLTKKQRKLVRAVTRNPSATLAALGQNAGYTSAQHVHRALNAPGVVGAMSEIRTLMGRDDRLALTALLGTLAEGLSATRPIITAESTIEIKDYAVRRNYMRDALELHGVLGNAATVAPTGPANIAIILAGGGSDADKAALVDVLLASRRVRGLHPVDNRLMTPEEIDASRRPI